MRCTSCNGPTRVTNSRPRSDGKTRRRRECAECGRRFSTVEIPASLAGGALELPDPEEKEGGMEAVRRRAIIHAERDALARRHAG